MAEETTVRNVRAPKEIFDRLAAMTKDNGFANQGAALEALLNTWQVQSSKDAIPAQRTAIEDFDSHMQAIQRAYLHALDLAQGAEARALDSFRAKLEALDEEKAELRRKLEMAKDDVAYYKGQAEAANKTATEITNEAEAREEKIRLLESTLESEKKNAAAQIADKQRLIDSLTTQLAEAHEDARTAEEAAKETDNLKAQLVNARQELADAQTAATVAAAKATAAQAEAVAAIQKETSMQILKLTGDNGALQVQLAEAKTQIAKLEATTERLLSTHPNTQNPTPSAPMNDQATQDTTKPPKRKTKSKTAKTAKATDTTLHDSFVEPIVEGEPPKN